MKLRFFFIISMLKVGMHQQMRPAQNSSPAAKPAVPPGSAANGDRFYS